MTAQRPSRRASKLIVNPSMAVPYIDHEWMHCAGLTAKTPESPPHTNGAQDPFPNNNHIAALSWMTEP
jgi:hypothetical protein